MQYVDGFGGETPGPLFPTVETSTVLRAVLSAKCKFERKMERKSSPHRIQLSVAQLFFSSAKVRNLFNACENLLSCGLTAFLCSYFLNEQLKDHFLVY